VFIRENDWNLARFTTYGDTAPCSLADILEVSFIRNNTLETFVGEVVSIRKDMTGKEVPKWNIEGHGQGRYMKHTAISVTSSLDLDSTILTHYMNLIPNLNHTIEFTNEETIGVTGRGMMYGNDAVSDLCRNASISFYTDTGSTVHFYKGVSSTYSTSFSNLILKEKTEDITNLANTVTLYSTSYIIDGDKDQYTESTVGWSGKKKWVGDDWEDFDNQGTLTTTTITPSIGNTALIMGDYSWDPDSVARLAEIWVHRPLTSTIIMDYVKLPRFYMDYFVSGKEWAFPRPGPGIVKIYLMDSEHTLPPDTTDAYFMLETQVGRAPSPLYLEEEERTIAWSTMGGKIKDTLLFTENQGIGSISHIGIHMKQPKYSHLQRLWFDKLHFRKFIVAAAENTASISKWGERVLIPKIYSFTEENETQLAARAVKLLADITEPEESIRNLEMEGTGPVYIGGRYTFTFPDTVEAYKVREIEHRFDGYDWKTYLVLSSSEVKEPIKERAKRIQVLDSNVLSLNRQVGELQEGERVIEEYIVTGQKTGYSGVPAGDIWDGTLHIKYLRINVATGGTFTIEEITNVEQMNVDNIGVIGTINTIHYMEADTIGSIGEITSIDRMNVTTIGTINTIEHVGILSVNTISSIEEITSCGILSVNTGTIGTLELTSNLVGNQVIVSDNITDLAITSGKVGNQAILADKMYISIGGQNLIDYSGFEEPGKWLDYWGYGLLWQQSPSGAFLGTYGLSCVRSVDIMLIEHPFTIGYGDEQIYLEPSTPYILSLYVNQLDTSTVDLSIARTTGVHAVTILDDSGATVTVPGWNRIRLAFLTPSNVSEENTFRVNFYHKVGTGYNTVYLDCAQLERSQSTFSVYPSEWKPKGIK